MPLPLGKVARQSRDGEAAPRNKRQGRIAPVFLLIRQHIFSYTISRRILLRQDFARRYLYTAIETMCRFLAYNTNAYVVRSSVSFDETSDICGASMVVSPKSEVLVNMRGRFGMETVEFDPKEKYYKAAGYGNRESAHYEYIEYGRKPWLYRNAGSSVVLPDAEMKYPRVCALMIRGGFS